MEHAIGRLGHEVLVEYVSGCSNVPAEAACSACAPDQSAGSWSSFPSCELLSQSVRRRGKALRGILPVARPVSSCAPIPRSAARDTTAISS